MNRRAAPLLAFWLVAFVPAALAVSPLVTDDADTTPAGQLQINSDFQFLRTGATTIYSTPINPVVGLLPSLELGAIFGYQWRQGSGSTPDTGDADTVTDFVLAPKFRFWEGFDNKLKIAGRIDLKLPTASDRHGLGTGDPDAGFVGVATFNVGKTGLDFNAGYYAIDISRTDPDNDRWFIGQSIRQPINENWKFLAEVFAILPNTAAGGRATVYFSGGPQWVVGKNFTLSALLGTAAGHKSPDFTGTIELTCQF